MRISDWSSDVCSSDLVDLQGLGTHAQQRLLGLVAVGDHAAVEPVRRAGDVGGCLGDPAAGAALGGDQQVARLAQPGADGVDDAAQLGVGRNGRSEEHTSELQSLMRISYAVFCLKKQKPNKTSE